MFKRKIQQQQPGMLDKYTCPCHLEASSFLQASHWQQYAQLELRDGKQGRVKTIFSRCLLNCYSITLWAAYLDFIKQVPASAACATSRLLSPVCVTAVIMASILQAAGAPTTSAASQESCIRGRAAGSWAIADGGSSIMRAASCTSH